MAHPPEMDTLRFEWKMPVGVDRSDDDPENPLSRALRGVLVDGSPIRRLSLAFIRSRGKPFYMWLGVFVHSQGDRTLFFPGFKGKGHVAFKGKVRQKTKGFAVDHISLDKDCSRWHLTSQGSRDHQGGPTTMDLGDERFLWFGFSVAKNDILSPVMRRTGIQVECPSSDSIRKAEIINYAREGLAFPLIDLPKQSPEFPPPLFAHFVVIVGPNGFENYTGDNLLLPLDAPWIKQGAKLPLKGLPSRIHRFSFGERDFQVISMLLPGMMTIPVFFSSPGMG